MPVKTPINKNRMRVHMNYNLWKYGLSAVLAIFAWSLIYTQTAYRSPQDKRIDIYIKSGTVDVDMCSAFFAPIKEATAPDMELINTVTILPGDDYSSTMQLQVYLFAGEGDIYFLPAADFKSYASMDTFVALDEMIESGILNVEGIDLSSAQVKTVENYDQNGEPVYGEETHIYGIPMDTLYAFMDGIQLDNRGMVMCVAINNQNDENVLPFFAALVEAGRGDMPEWLTTQ